LHAVCVKIFLELASEAAATRKTCLPPRVLAYTCNKSRARAGVVSVVKRRRLGGRRTLPFRHVFVFSVVLFIAVTVWGLWLINNGIKPVLLNIAETKAKQVAVTAINYGIKNNDLREMKKYSSESGGTDKLINIKYDKNGEITSVTIDTYAVTKLLTMTTQDIQEYLRLVEDGKVPAEPGLSDAGSKNGIIAYIPLGQAANNVLLSNLGPKIPVRIDLISNVKTNLKSDYQHLNINNTYIQLFIHVKVDVQAVIPFGTKPVTVEQNIFLVSHFIPGEVPIYWGSGGNNSSIVLPDEKSKKSAPKNP
jgi:sporulation protein YunB